MSDHPEKTCPRCGEAAADYRFCPFCGLNLASSEVATQEPGAGDPDQRRPDLSVQPSTFAGLSAGDSNGAGDHSGDEVSATAVPEIRFDRSDSSAVEAATQALPRAAWQAADSSEHPADARPESAPPVWVSGDDSNAASEDTADGPSATHVGFVRLESSSVEPTADIAEIEVPARADWETRGPSQQPAYGRLEPAPAVSDHESNGATEQTADETADEAGPEVSSDRSSAEDISREGLDAEPWPTDRGPAESSDESVLEHPLPLRDQDQPSARPESPRPVAAHETTRSTGSHRTVAFLIALIGLLLLMATRRSRAHD